MENGIWRQVSAEPALALGDVFRMVSKIPVILEQACALPSISDLDLFSDTASHVVQEMFSSVRTLDMWINEFISTFPNNRYWPVQSIARNVADNGQHRVFPTCFEFQTISIAAPIVQTWAALAQLYSNIIQIHDLVQARLGQPISLEELQTTPGAMIELEGENLSIAEIQAEGTRMLRNVCQSMEYFHRMEMGTYGNHAITYPAWSARQYARLHPGHERELTWLQNMHKMEGSGTRWGMSKMTFADIAEPIGGWSRHGQYGKNINGVEIGMRTGETGSSWDRSSMEMGFSSIGSSEQ